MNKGPGIEIRPKVLAVAGSPRKGGNSDALLKAVTKGFRDQGVESKKVNLRDFQFRSCTGCERCRKDKSCTGHNDGMTLLYPHLIASKGLVLISPTHHYNVTALMKAFIDRLYCFYEFGRTRPRTWKSRLAGQNRKAVIAAICEQTTREDMGMTLEAMRRPLEALGYEIVDEIAVYGLFDRGAIQSKPKILSRAERAAKELARHL